MRANQAGSHGEAGDIPGAIRAYTELVPVWADRPPEARRCAQPSVRTALPVLDDAKHYRVSEDEVDKLLRAGDGWLHEHPAKELITRRYLANRRSLAQSALERLRAASDELEAIAAPAAVAEELAEVGAAERRKPLVTFRHEAVLAALAHSGATRVLDLGCGSGTLLLRLMADRRYTEIVGADVSSVNLQIAERRLKLDQMPERQRSRIRLRYSCRSGRRP